MLIDELITYHADMLQNYFNFWEREDERKNLGISLTEVAYNILMNTGMLYRYTDDKSIIDIITGEIKDNLINKGLEYAQKLTILSSLESILKKDIVSDSDLEDVETLIEYRDELEMVLFMSGYLIKPKVYSGDFTVLNIISSIRGYATAFDQTLFNRIDMYTVASRRIAHLAEHIKISLIKRNFWWFYSAPILDAKVETTLRNLSVRMTDKIKREKAGLTVGR